MTRIRTFHTYPIILCVCTVALLAQNYPPPFPRPDAVKVFENDRVEVWDVTWPKGQPTPMHEHPYDQLSITLVAGSVKVTRPGGNPTMGNSRLGSVSLTRTGTVHAEVGMSDVAQHKIMVQLKLSAYGFRDCFYRGRYYPLATGSWRNNGRSTKSRRCGLLTAQPGCSHGRRSERIAACDHRGVEIARHCPLNNEVC